MAEIIHVDGVDCVVKDKRGGKALVQEARTGGRRFWAQVPKAKKKGAKKVKAVTEAKPEPEAGEPAPESKATDKE